MADLFADRLFNALERTEPEVGMLLVAAPGMASPEFARAVILLVEYNSPITLGVNLASRSDVAVFNVLPDWLPLVAKPQALYIGGPLQQQTVLGLGVTKPGVDIQTTPFVNRLANRLVHVDMGTAPAELTHSVESMRLFAGYAVWAPEQLAAEIDRGDWYVTPALPSDVIAPGSRDLWGDVMRRQPVPLPLYSTFPVHLEDN